MDGAHAEIPPRDLVDDALQGGVRVEELHLTGEVEEQKLTSLHQRLDALLEPV